MASSNYYGSLSPASSSNIPRPRPATRRTASSYDGRSYEHQHHRAASSSSALPFPRPQPFTRPTSPVTPPPQLVTDPRFTRLFSTSLGSPFLTTDESLPHLELQLGDSDARLADLRPPSPVPTVDFSIIDVDPEDSDTNPFIPGGYPSGQPRFISSPMVGLGFSRGRPVYASNSNTGLGAILNPGVTRDQQPLPSHNSLKSFLPRLWDALSSPGRTVLNFSPSTNAMSTSPSSSPSSSRTASPSRYPPSQSWYANNGGTNGRHSPVYWNANNNKGKGKSKTGGLFTPRNGNNSRAELNEYINYLELPPLGGEEGELIDDEACFINVRAVTGIDILSLLPAELALHILTLLAFSSSQHASDIAGSTSLSPGRSSAIINEADAPPHASLRALLVCRQVSRTWCRLASDNAVWRALFLGRWKVDLRRSADIQPGTALQRRNARTALGKTWDFDMVDIGAKAKRLLGLSTSVTRPVVEQPILSAPLQLDWRVLYHERLELDSRWPDTGSAGPRRIGDSSMGLHGSSMDVDDSEKTTRNTWEPKIMEISGHVDSVYCLEFDSRRIITGSRDRTIKVWSLHTGTLLGTFVGAHLGSVLCLKFERDWDRDWEGDDSLERDDSGSQEMGDGDDMDVDMSYGPQPQSLGSKRRKDQGGLKRGFMVSGSSDCSVCVWDLQLGDVVERKTTPELDDDKQAEYVDEQGERAVKAEVRAVLKGHVGGVLDLRIDKRWIVSCSKDAVIRVWDRRTLKLHRTLRGHEGPVNAVGLQSGRVVSASGDGKMILWDIASGERLRTFEGHDRGLACIEFKDDLIVSGSNDCKIKVWSASTGECLRTLVGHEALVRALSFDPRSGRLVSASYDKSVKLWDLGSGKLIRELKKTHTSHIFDVKFDVARIVSTSHDRRIVVLDFSAGLDAALFV